MQLWDAVLATGTSRCFVAGEVLVDRGAVGGHCYAIRSGEVTVTATSVTGHTVVLGRRGRGSLIGDLAAVDGLPRTATVVARGEVTASALSSDAVIDLIRHDPDLAIAELQRLTRHIRDLTDRFVGRNDDVRERIVQLLATHTDITGEVEFRSTREELAGWVGASREGVVRVLRRMSDDGLITMRRGSVELRVAP